MKPTTASPTNTLSETQRIEIEHINLLFKQSPMGIAATVFNGLVCAFLLRHMIASQRLLGWFGALTIIALVRVFVVYRYHRKADSIAMASRYKLYNILTLAVSGLVWGSSAVFLFAPESVSHQLFLALVTVGMVAGATMAFSVFQGAFLAFAIPTLMPITIRLMTSAGEVHLFAGLLGIIYFVLSIFISRNIKKNRRDYVKLKETLAEQVIQQTDALRQTNARLQAENQKRERIQAQLEETRKFEAIANLAGGIAHQFNNALSVIMGNAELLRLDQKNPSAFNNYLEPINKSANLMSQLTSQLLAYAKGGKYKSQAMELGPFVKATLTTLQHTFSMDLKVTTEFDKSTAKVEIDITQMQMVISALIANAADATNQKGPVHFSCRSVAISSPLSDRHGELPPGDYMVLEVTDEGIGMNEETQQRIFEPFFTTKFQGRGLGMAAVYGIVKNHQGHITISSQTGKGTMVCIYLPVTEHRAAQPAAKTSAGPLISGSGKILLIEDETMVMAINQQLLKRLGYSVVPAPDGQSALKAIRNTEIEFDLVLLDLKLPDMDGAAIYPILRSHRPASKVIICSGYALEGRTQTLLDQGADGFLQKPFSLESLSTKLSQVLSGQSSSPQDAPTQ